MEAEDIRQQGPELSERRAVASRSRLGARHNLSRAVYFTLGVGVTGADALHDAARSKPVRMARRRFDGLVARGEAEWAHRRRLHLGGGDRRTASRPAHGLSGLARGAVDVGGQVLDGAVALGTDLLLPRLAQNRQLDLLVQAIAGRYMEYLQHHPDQLDGVVPSVAGPYLDHLAQHPEELDGLVHAVANRYITYLNENPAPVQQLLQGQSLSLAQETASGVRRLAMRVDGRLERIVRSLFGRTPRESLPPPPPEVRHRAGAAGISLGTYAGRIIDG